MKDTKNTPEEKALAAALAEAAKERDTLRAGFDASCQSEEELRGLLAAMTKERDEWKDCAERRQERWAKRCADRAAALQSSREEVRALEIHIAVVKNAAQSLVHRNGGPIDGLVRDEWKKDGYVMVRREDFDSVVAALSHAPSAPSEVKLCGHIKTGAPCYCEVKP